MHSYTGRQSEAQRPMWRWFTDRDSIARRLDWPLLGAALALSLLGATVVYSATRARTDLTGDDPYFFLMRHLLNICIGCGLAALVVWLGHSRLRDLVPVLYAGTLLLCLLVLSPLGSNVNGSQSWIQLGGGFAFQPSELVKVSVILAMATLLAAGVEGDNNSVPDTPAVLRALGLVAVPAVLILATPDVGTTLVLAAIALGVLMSSGAARRWIIGLVTAGLLLAVAVWLLGVLDQYQINRFAAFANPALDPAGVGYNTNQARIAIGSGGLFGQGLFHGSQTLGQFVPEQHTDFIFTVVGEELGFVGGAAVIGLFGVIMWRGCVIAMKSPDVYGTIVAGGIVTWIAFQSFENMGMALGIMPVTGVPLPFLSYGGSSTFAIWIAVGLLLAIQVRRKTKLN
ncbi:rod shape-determining protein [Streptomyces xiamenensis]|uniref:peptidoglycan glycosyltransferase n=2 Tax=Streptomyces TaxID=1883 RepID=A0A0F7FXC1_9ACTN|nr:rod shape-determining protein [Streptomyces xiamenensis]